MVKDRSAFLLALLNSAPVVGGARTDELADDASAARWLTAHAPHAEAVDRRLLRTARDLLQDVVRGRRPATALAPLLDDVRSIPLITDDALRWTIETAEGRALAVEAVLAWDDLRRSMPGRLRPCANDECELFLLDHSRPNNARWCSMAVCGNKLKARRHYRRTRLTDPG
jgi:predicted RNA-binding Zn ribbon-like protein